MVSRSHAKTLLGSLLVGAALLPVPAAAWGHFGHLLVSKIAIQKLPEEIPAFLRSAAAVQEISELGAEADVSKSTGTVTSGGYPANRTAFTIHDGERDNGHFIDLNDDGTVLGGIPFAPLLSSRRDFDTALRAVGQNQYGVGFLAYNLVDRWQQIRKDFAYIRAFTKAIQTATNPADRAFFQYQLQLRQKLTIRDIGYWSHFVGDGSQPMHVSVHFNGWGNYPNPNGYTNAPIHGPFEGNFVKSFVSPAAVATAVPGYVDCGCTNEQRVVQYLQASLAQVGPVYAAGTPDNYVHALPAEVDIATKRLAAGAAELRDQIVDAWRSSTTVGVGFPVIRVTEIESGAVLLTPDRFAGD